MSQIKVLKRGDFLFKEGDKTNLVYVIQSGGLSQCLIKNKKPVDLFQIGANQVLNEGVLYGAATSTTSAFATSEVKYLELAADIFKTQIDGTNPVIRTLVKSLVERLRLATNEVKSSRMEKDGSPCPDDQIARAFGAVFHTANHKGEKDKAGMVSIQWSMMKQYAQRVFGESPKRLEQSLQLLAKLKLVRLEMGVDPDDPEGDEVLEAVHFQDLQVIETFFEFYQYHFFKGSSKTDLLKFDDFCNKFVSLFIKLSQGKVADRFGSISIDYHELTAGFKKEFSLDLKPDHFTRLEQKGVYSKRVSDKNGVQLQFELKEYINIIYIWKIINEIDKWNTKGFIDMTEDLDQKPDSKSDGPTCSECGAAYIPNQKFCGECGFKIAA
ncbi:MAG: cyclic nucleotide-binding domain-containing protein [Pseudobdellovibrionaceae bacterium]